jgi:death on curing protein
VRYLTLPEAFLLAERVTGIDAATLVRASRTELLDSALHAPQAGFGDVEFHPTLREKAAALCWHIAQNHPLPDGNKRLAWVSLVTFCQLNGHDLSVPVEDAVTAMLAVAAGEMDQGAFAAWLGDRLVAR